MDPDWWRDAVVYQVYPRSFADSDADGLGDLRGVISRVDYLRSLGIDAVWLSPFYPSPLADGGYDVVDYRDVDSRLGTLADLDDLIEALHEAGIRLIIDIVPNHSSSEHPWFRAALASPRGSEERERYVFMEGAGADGSEPPSDWQSHFGGSAWERTPDGQFYLHLFAEEQPDFNWSHPDVRKEFLAILGFWSDRGVDGFRIDVAHTLVKDLAHPLRSQPTIDSLLPEDGSDPLYDRDELHQIYREWRELFDRYDPPRMAVAEAWVPASRRVRYASPESLGQAFNFDLLRAPWDAAAFAEIIARNLRFADEAHSSSTWVLSNHDVVRHATRYALPDGADLDAWLLEGRPLSPAQALQGDRRARAAAMLVLALPGSVYLYQGEELGLHEVSEIGIQDLQDPIWRRSEGRQKGRDGCRVPLPWTAAGRSFGFGANGSHLPQPRWFASHAADVEERDPGSMLSLYRSAIALRRLLRTEGGVSGLPAVRRDGDLVVIEREGGLTSVTNFSSEPVRWSHGGRVLLSSSDLTSEPTIPGETTVWFGELHESSIAEEAGS
ncbi:alpha-amylase family glycosyl hydrolase [Demequina sp. SYSU T00039]|uniref:Alpha-amylase family glycosyl hydrolase n=1 Tax=Demequina lignilytica TaxID=3051663 RepID=A0AAW7M3Y2_9MICO|nr:MULTISPECIES: alpha-amylase family glycosyl hydrolase [unclassified Demequina]MDN4479211.1 alpha-amylase family glycosyl hydrolase [Demequina sp. SYSU T00039-1]MDN4487930.1 alpha-amylase family glycosyl hydrolase [Demequina sp. SYSU T00039]MDN4491736.1 alpha-amylase family glycosyl hydrolase [Demequina sp. SYSU T00068]